MEKIESIKIHHVREGKKFYSVPRQIDFYNADEKRIAIITFDKNSGELSIHPWGANITMFENNGHEFYKSSNKYTRWVTTEPVWEERVFPEENDSRIDPYKQTKISEG